MYGAVNYHPYGQPQKIARGRVGELVPTELGEHPTPPGLLADPIAGSIRSLQSFPQGGKRRGLASFISAIPIMQRL